MIYNKKAAPFGTAFYFIYSFLSNKFITCSPSGFTARSKFSNRCAELTSFGSSNQLIFKLH
jgi:hypothetical protein